MTSINFVSRVPPAFSCSTEKQDTLENKSSQMAKDLYVAAFGTAAWTGLSFIGEAALGVLFPNPQYVLEARKILREQVKSCIKNRASNPNATCIFLSEVRNTPLYNLNNTKIAAEFMLASTLSHVALKSLGFKPPLIVSAVAGLAITTLIENHSISRLLLSQTYSIAVDPPIIGAGVVFGTLCLTVAARKALAYLSNTFNNVVPSEASNDGVVDGVVLEI